MTQYESELVFRLRERARIRRQIPGRKSVQEGKPDRMADLLDEAANYLEGMVNQRDANVEKEGDRNWRKLKC
jgi:hypothetical protein